MARDNPLWGSERIRGELLKLGIAVSKRSIQRYRRRGPARPPRQTWRTFQANHAGALWAVDQGMVQTLTFKTLYALALIAHGRRALVHVAVTVGDQRNSLIAHRRGHLGPSGAVRSRSGRGAWRMTLVGKTILVTGATGSWTARRSAGWRATARWCGRWPGALGVATACARRRG